MSTENDNVRAGSFLYPAVPRDGEIVLDLPFSACVCAPAGTPDADEFAAALRTCGITARESRGGRQGAQFPDVRRVNRFRDMEWDRTYYFIYGLTPDIPEPTGLLPGQWLAIRSGEDEDVAVFNPATVGVEFDLNVPRRG